MNKRKWTEIYIPDITRKLKYKASNFTKNCGIPFEPRHSMWYAGWHYRLLNIDKKSLALFSKQWNEVEKTRIHGSIAREGLGFKRAVEKNGNQHTSIFSLRIFNVHYWCSDRLRCYPVFAFYISGKLPSLWYPSRAQHPRALYLNTAHRFILRT